MFISRRSPSRILMDDSTTRTAPLVRRIVTLGTPLVMAVVSVLHPISAGPSVVADLQPRLDLWLGIHVFQLVMIGLLGATLWLLISGRVGRAATVGRVAIVVFLVFYAAFDGIVGIGTGLLVGLTQRLSGPEQAAAVQVAQAFWNARLDPSTPLPYLILVGSLAWLVAACAVAVTLRRSGARWPVVVLLVLAGIIFGIDHPFPTGTAGMLCLLGAVVLLEQQGLRRSDTTAAQPTS
jgi:hypothetical protein